jgi:hypothetical protein
MQIFEQSNERKADRYLQEQKHREAKKQFKFHTRKNSKNEQRLEARQRSNKRLLPQTKT